MHDGRPLLSPLPCTTSYRRPSDHALDRGELHLVILRTRAGEQDLTPRSRFVDGPHSVHELSDVDTRRSLSAFLESRATQGMSPAFFGAHAVAAERATPRAPSLLGRNHPSSACLI
jgi:hypothetical protein